jgi:nitrogen fixation protein FixH
MKAMFWVAAGVVVVTVALLLWAGGSRATTLTVHTAQHRVSMTVDNSESGVNTLDFEVTDPGGRPVDVDTLTVELVMSQMGHALPPVMTVRTGSGRYRASNADIPMSGQWEVAVSVPGAGKVVFPLLVD